MKTTRLITFLITLSLATTSLWAANIRGKIVDADNNGLPGTAVQLIALPDTVRAGYQISNEKGSFVFRNIKPGNYVFIATMVGMDDIAKNISVSDTTKMLNLGNIVMHESAIMLQEAVVTGIKTDMVVKQDTVEFNAGSYHTAPNATVNDLLKKLPGVEIGSDGSITSNGKTISKILIDGKEFFGDDPQMATKNLPSNMVDRVQVVDRKSDLARLTGVDDGEEETVINLTVKKDMNNGYFGNISAGYGTDDRYQGSFIVNKFFNGNQITFLGGLNNINESGFSDRGRGNFRSFGGNGGITTAQRLGMNFNVGKGEIFRVGGNILYSHSKKFITTKSEKIRLYQGYNNYQSENSTSHDNGHNVSSDFRLQWKPDENNTFEFRPNFRINMRNSNSTENTVLRDNDMNIINTNRNIQTNKGTSVNAGGDLIYNHKFASKPGRSFSIQVDYSFSNTRQYSSTWNDIDYEKLDSIVFENRWMDNHTWNNNISTRLTWTEPIGNVKNGNFFNIAYRLRYRWNNADKMTYQLPDPLDPLNFIPIEYTSTPVGAEFLDSLSNSFRNNYFNQEIQIGYKKVNKKLNLDAGLAFTPTSSKSTDLINSARNIPTRNVFNVAPYLRIRWKFTQTASLRANYRARTNQPSMTQLQPVADVSNSLNITQGNPDLKPSFTQSLNFNYNDFNMKNAQGLMLMLNGSMTTNNIVSKSTNDSETGKRFTTYVNSNNSFSLFGMAMINRPFRNKKWRFNARLNGNYNTNPGYVNGDYNRTNNIRLSPGIGLTFQSEIFQISVNPNYSANIVTNSLPNQANRTTDSYGAFSWASLELPFGIQLNTDLVFSKTTGMSAGYDSEQWLWNAQLSYSFLSDKSLTLAARAYDLLGMKKSISRSVTNSQIEDSETNTLTRYVMFSLTWNFNTLKKKGKGPTGEDREFGPGPGGRGGMGGGRRPF